MKLLIKPLALACCAWPLLASATISSPESREHLNLTLYQGNFAMIQDTRAIDLISGIQSIEFMGVSSAIMPDTVLLGGDDTRVIERNYSYDLISLDALLKAHIGQTLTLNMSLTEHTSPLPVSAELLAVRGGHMIVKYKPIGKLQAIVGALSVGGYADKIVFESIPNTLSESPTLSMRLEASKSGPQTMTLTYLSNGFDWESSYVANLQDEGHMALDAWVTLRNQTDQAFDNAQVQLLAGQVNRQAYSPRREQMMMKAALAEMDSNAGNVSANSVGDYKLYTLPYSVDLKAKQNKQVSLFSADQVQIDKDYDWSLDITQSSPRQKARVSIRFDNTKERGLGLPMPAGTLRFYDSDENGRAQFIGETRLTDLDRHETFKASIGEAFSLSATNKLYHWDAGRGELKGDLVLVNSSQADKVVNLTMEPLRVNPPHQRAFTVSLCDMEAMTLPAQSPLRLQWTLPKGVELVNVQPDTDGQCKISLKLMADATYTLPYQYRMY